MCHLIKFFLMFMFILIKYESLPDQKSPLGRTRLAFFIDLPKFAQVLLLSSQRWLKTWSG